MSDQLDLDALVPPKKTITVNKTVYTLNPIRLVDFLNVQKIFVELRNTTDEEKLVLFGKIFESIKPVVPQIDEMNLSLDQGMALLEFIYGQGEQMNNKIEPEQIEKKI